MLNLPNLLSITRIILILPFILLLVHQRYGWAVAVFVAAAMTDAIDGALARVLRQRTQLGAYLDPAADKLLMTASFIALASLQFLPIWLTGLVILRDVIIVLGLIILRITSRSLEIRPSIASKLTTVFQLGTIVAALLFPSGLLTDLFIALAAITTVISGLQYVAKGLKILKEREAGL
ncbi:MAG TPA: CDP-alcohol phosphatidyltransferase family protein [Thermodesulfobacteriota bacterium]|nr:CDP-alcohol phosphatidyltransferase family protein [Thermodesulfobacteriota bacterium]